MEPEERVNTLLNAAQVSGAYDEVVDQIAVRVAETGSLGKLELGALSAWKRLRADTPWMAQLMSFPDEQVRLHTQRAVSAARDESKAVPVAAAAARSADATARLPPR